MGQTTLRICDAMGGEVSGAYSRHTKI
jgi:hypothetical protein